jgi:threonine dehydrogenase-like Zn-dependent dehydrogenase
MKAIQIMAPEKVEIVDVPVPEAQDSEVLVKIVTVATCPHWDITLYRGIDILERPGHPVYPIPVGFPGHEMAGEVVAVGPGANTFKIGDRVATTRTAGTTKPGFYCEYINRPEDMLAQVPDNISYEGAATMELARHVASHIRVANFKDLRVGVTGLGGGGLISLQMVKALGAREVVGIDIDASRLVLAAKLGADETVNTTVEGDLAGLEAHPLEASVDCSGAAAGLQVALDHTRGPVAIFGMVHGDATFSMRHWLQNTSIVERKAPNRSDTEFVQDLWRKGKLNTEVLISARMPFENYEAGVKMLMERRAIKVCFYPGKTNTDE